MWHSPQSRSTSFFFQALLCYESSTRLPCSYTVPIPESSTTFSVSAISGLQRCDTNTGSVCETQRSAQVGTSGNKREQGKTGRPTSRNKRPISGNKGRNKTGRPTTPIIVLAIGNRLDAQQDTVSEDVSTGLPVLFLLCLPIAA